MPLSPLSRRSGISSPLVIVPCCPESPDRNRQLPVLHVPPSKRMVWPSARSYAPSHTQGCVLRHSILIFWSGCLPAGVLSSAMTAYSPKKTGGMRKGSRPIPCSSFTKLFPLLDNSSRQQLLCSSPAKLRKARCSSIRGPSHGSRDLIQGDVLTYK